VHRNALAKLELARYLQPQSPAPDMPVTRGC